MLGERDSSVSEKVFLLLFSLFPIAPLFLSNECNLLNLDCQRWLTSIICQHSTQSRLHQVINLTSPEDTKRNIRRSRRGFLLRRYRVFLHCFVAPSTANDYNSQGRNECFSLLSNSSVEMHLVSFLFSPLLTSSQIISGILINSLLVSVHRSFFARSLSDHVCLFF